MLSFVLLCCLLRAMVFVFVFAPRCVAFVLLSVLQRGVDSCDVFVFSVVCAVVLAPVLLFAVVCCSRAVMLCVCPCGCLCFAVAFVVFAAVLPAALRCLPAVVLFGFVIALLFLCSRCCLLCYAVCLV